MIDFHKPVVCRIRIRDVDVFVTETKAERGIFVDYNSEINFFLLVSGAIDTRRVGFRGRAVFGHGSPIEPSVASHHLSKLNALCSKCIRCGKLRFPLTNRRFNYFIVAKTFGLVRSHKLYGEKHIVGDSVEVKFYRFVARMFVVDDNIVEPEGQHIGTLLRVLKYEFVFVGG